MADWTFNEFGLVGFISFGQANRGARDAFVYAYSHDHPRADTPADSFVLMRAPNDKMKDRNAWEFYGGLNDKKEPIWSTKIQDRAAVFKNPDSCLRSAMSYNPNLRRYLRWQQIPQLRGHENRGDTRFEGGFAIYDAREPWGPWTAACFTLR